MKKLDAPSQEVSEVLRFQQGLIDKLADLLDQHRPSFSVRVEDGEVVCDPPPRETR